MPPARASRRQNGSVSGLRGRPLPAWRLFPNFRVVRVTDDPAEELEDGAEDVADVLSVLQAARKDLESLKVHC